MASAQEIAQVLGLQEHREGGMFRELYRSVVRTHATKQRRAATSIFYMLRARDVSTWHLVKSDEIWMYHAGSSAVQLLLLPDGTFEERVIGPAESDSRLDLAVNSADRPFRRKLGTVRRRGLSRI